MSKLALVVELKIAAGRLDDFVARATRHGETCRAEEPGCLRFDLLVPRDGGGRVLLYELYSDQAAVDAHLSTGHMARYLEDTEAMIAGRTRTVCELVNG